MIASECQAPSEGSAASATLTSPSMSWLWVLRVVRVLRGKQCVVTLGIEGTRGAEIKLVRELVLELRDAPCKMLPRLLVYPTLERMRSVVLFGGKRGTEGADAQQRRLRLDLPFGRDFPPGLHTGWAVGRQCHQWGGNGKGRRDENGSGAGVAHQCRIRRRAFGGPCTGSSTQRALEGAAWGVASDP